MKVSNTSIDSVKIVEPDVFGDNRGWFCEQYNEARYRAAGINAAFVQDNESFSSKGVVRGLHWQAGEHCQAKLVRVIRGAVWDVAVDVRKGSPTFGKYASVVLEDETLFSYKCDNLYCKESERGLMFNDPALKIEWPKIDVEIKLSEKDRKHPCLASIEPWEGLE